MATISILSFGNPSAMQTQGNNNTTGLKISSINQSTKCGATTTTTTQSSNNNNNCSNDKNVNNNNNSDKTANFNGKLNTSTPNKPNNKRSYNVMAKKQKTLPLSETNSNIVTTTTMTAASAATNQSVRSAKLAKTLKPEIDTNILCRASGGKSKIFPLPVAVARRNARERNRVKQVNNGFAALRERIPDEVAEAFEAQGNGRGSVKKLSKVETLRMAVEYIRSLEKVLEFDSEASGGSSSAQQPLNDCNLSNESYHLSDTSSVLSTLTPPPSSGSFDDSDCMLPDVTMIDGHQYVRIAGTNTYQLFDITIGDSPTTSAIYENDENIEPSMLENHHQHVLLQQQQSSPPTDYSAHDVDAVHCYSGNGIYSTPIHILTPASISPSTYSGQSVLSPAQNIAAIHDILPSMAMTTTTTHRDDDHRQPFLMAATTKTIIKNECISLPSNDGNDSDSALYLSPMHTTHLYDGTTTVMTTMKIKDDIDLDEQALSEESMLEAMNWWHSQQANDNVIANNSS